VKAYSDEEAMACSLENPERVKLSINAEGRMMNDEFGANLKIRTKSFALRIIKLFRPTQETEASVIGKQVLRSGTSVGAHTRSMQSTLLSGVHKQDAIRLQNWTRPRIGSSCSSRRDCNRERLASLQQEANELTAIFVSSVKTAKSRKVK
jgi:hypothetical protein